VDAVRRSTPRRGRGAAPFSAPREVAGALSAYALYLAVGRGVVHRDGRARALRNAQRVLRLERRLGVAVEARAQRVLARHRRVVIGLDASYVTLNVVLTVGRLIWLFHRRDPRFHPLRRAATGTVLGAELVSAVAPVAPPRMLDGFIDTGKLISGLDLDSTRLARLYHQYAAMPSIHVAFAVLTAAEVRHPAGRALAALYPPAVAGLVIVTANHFVLDVVAGAALARGALRLARR